MIERTEGQLRGDISCSEALLMALGRGVARADRSVTEATRSPWARMGALLFEDREALKYGKNREGTPGFKAVLAYGYRLLIPSDGYLGFPCSP